MKWLKELDDFLLENKIIFKGEEILSPHTTIKIGGKALRTVYPSSVEELLLLLEFLERKEIPWYIVGGGSNLLIADEGYEGVVIMTKSLRGVQTLHTGNTLRLKVLAGTKINEIFRVCFSLGYSGFEFLAGVPATLGGAIKMNAGAFGKSTSSLVKKNFPV